MRSDRRKSVRFSPMSEVRYVPRPTVEVKQERWYSIEDVSKFRMILGHDIDQCSRMLILKSEQGLGISEDERDMCVGIEHFLSCNVKEKILMCIAAKKRHLYVVLMEQARQKHFHVDSVEELGRVSMRSSHRARQRSYMIASLSIPALS